MARATLIVPGYCAIIKTRLVSDAPVLGSDKTCSSIFRRLEAFCLSFFFLQIALRYVPVRNWLLLHVWIVLAASIIAARPGLYRRVDKKTLGDTDQGIEDRDLCTGGVLCSPI